eukprot:257400-Prorocentrum_lima.AAC.1
MAMLEPSLKDLSELKGRVIAQALELEEHKQTLFQLIEDRRKGDVDGESGMGIKEVKLLKQDITQLKD